MTFVFPVERGDQKAFIALAVTFAIVPACATSLRLLARRIANRKLDLSDWLMVLASVLLIFYQGVNISAVLVGGLGYPLEEIKGRFGIASGAMMFVKHLIVMQMFWCITITIIKISVLHLYVRVFSLPGFVIAAKVTGVFIIMWAIIMGLGASLICRPFSFYWDKSIEGGWCGNSNALWIATGIMNIVSDAAILVLPLPYLLSLELALYKKVVLIVTFSVGFLVCIVSAVRIHVLISYNPEDTTGTTLPTALLSFLEPSVGLTISCIPLLRPILVHVISTISKSSVERKTSSNPFSRLPDQGSQIHLRQKMGPDTRIMNMTVASHADGSDGGDQDIELGRIEVRKSWKIEQQTVGENSHGPRGLPPDSNV